MMRSNLNTDAWGKVTPGVAREKDAAIDDGRVKYMYGKLETINGNGFTARVWQEERHRATITVLETGEQQTIQASSSHSLRELILHHEATLLAKRLQAQVDLEEPTTSWIATLDFQDGSSERAEASSREDLMLVLLKAKARDTIAIQPTPREHYPAMTEQEISEQIAVRNFLDVVGNQYTPCERTQKLLSGWLKARRLPMTCENLLRAFDDFNDHGFDMTSKEDSNV